MRHRRDAVGLVVALAAFAGTAALADTGVVAGEAGAFRAINRLPDLLYVVIWPFMQYGVFITTPALALVALALRRPRLGATIAMAGLGVYVLAKVVKRVVRRGRPDAYLAEVIEREPFGASLGYPSGHAAVAGALTVVLWDVLPGRWRWLPPALLAVVVVGRTYVGAHLPLDLVGGALLGAAAGFTALLVVGRPAGGAGAEDHGGGDLGPCRADDRGGHRGDMAMTGEHTGPARERTTTAPDTRRVPPFSRHAGDAVRVGLGLLVLGASVLLVQHDRLSVFERDVFRLVNNLPDLFWPVLLVVMQAGNLVAGPLAAAGVALVARLRRMALDLVIAGPAAWLAAKVVKGLVERPRPAGFLADLARQETTGGLGFVSGHSAVAAALATVAGPYLPRPARRAVWGIALVVGVARVYAGAHLPLDIVGGLALGWSIGAAVHLVLGAPRLQMAPAQVVQLASRAGVALRDVVTAPGRARGSVPFVATGADGRRLFVKVLDPDPRDRDLSYRLVRMLTWRELRDEAEAPDAVVRAEHEAAMGALARAAGCRTPVVRAVRAWRSRAVVVQDLIDGPSLDRAPASALDGAVLRSAWEQVVRLHAAGLAHRDLVAANIVVDADGACWLVDLAHAQSGAAAQAQENDIAELLASTACLVGAHDAVRAAAGIVPTDALRRSLPGLQPLALTPATRAALRRRPDLLEDVRAALAETCGRHLEVPRPRFRPRPGAVAAVAVAGLGGLGALVAMAGTAELEDAVTSVGLRWLGAAVLAAAVAMVLDAATLVRAVGRRLGVGRTVLVQLTATAAAGLADGAAAREVVARHLGRAAIAEGGSQRATALAAGARRVLLPLGALAGAVLGQVSGVSWTAPRHWAVGFGAIVACLALAGLARPPAAAAPAAPAAVGSSHPWRHRLLVGVTSLAGVAAWAVAATAVVQAVGGGAPVAAALAVVAAVVWIAELLPMRAPGAAEVALFLGLAAVGMSPMGAALAAVVIRVLTHWAPLAVGLVLSRPLDRRLVL